MKNHALAYQAAIEAIAEIKATQDREGGGNYSRDLYPFRAIINAALDAELTSEETLAEIDRQIEKHRNYGGIPVRAESVAKPTPSTEVHPFKRDLTPPNYTGRSRLG